MIQRLKKEFDYCLIDCPAGIEDGFHFAISAADRAIVVTTPHISAVRDAARVLYLLEEQQFLQVDLIINEVDERLIKKHNMLTVSDIEEILGLGCLGSISVDNHVIISQNQGIPVVSVKRSQAAKDFKHIVRRLEDAKIYPFALEEYDKKKKKQKDFEGRREFIYEIS